MAKKAKYYLNRHTLYEGAVVLFRRPDSRKPDKDRMWQARIKLDGRTGYKTVSLKTPIYERAYREMRSRVLWRYLRGGFWE